MQERLKVNLSTWVVIIPGQPFLGMLGKFSGMFLKCCKVIKGIDTSQIASMDFDAREN